MIRPRPPLEKRWRLVAGAAVGLAYAVCASFTRPFTVSADALTAVPLAGAVLIVVMRSRRPTPRTDPGRIRTTAAPSPWWGAWLVVLAAVVAWELFCYVSGPRHAYPTFSSLLDVLDAHRPGKAAAYGAWLALGWYLVR
ncbi:MAG: hypothetical protein ABSG81_04355 [Acidimicrobiales bacterium]